MLQDKKISLVTRFMDRGEHLKQSLPSWLAIPQIDEIIIVDWDSRKDNALEIVKEAQAYNPQERQIPIYILRVNNQEFFNRGQALNTGCHFASGDFIFHVDADVILQANPLNTVILDKYILWRATDRWSSLCGTCIFSRELWYQVGGYAEFQKGWGHDDDYFHAKLYPLGVKKHYMDFSCFNHIDHDDIKSCVYHDMQDRWKSRDLNVATSLLIQKVFFQSLKVAVYEPDGKAREYDFPVQFIDKKEPIEKMEEIYREKKVPQEIKRSPEYKKYRRENPVSVMDRLLVQKTSFMPILNFPRPGRL